MPTRPTGGLTTRQKNVLEHIRQHTVASGAPPTVREIAAHFGYASIRAAAQHIEALERKGFLTRQRGLARNIRLVNPPAGIPLLGLVPANPDFAPIEADRDRTEIRIGGPVVAVWRTVEFRVT